jgi:hypothetical protein
MGSEMISIGVGFHDKVRQFYMSQKSLSDNFPAQNLLHSQGFAPKTYQAL